MAKLRTNGTYPVGIQSNITEEDAALLARVVEEDERPEAWVIRTALHQFLARWETKNGSSDSAAPKVRRPALVTVDGFVLASGRQVAWAEATVADLEERISDLDAVFAGQRERYESQLADLRGKIEAIQKAGTTTLGEAMLRAATA